MLQHLSRKGLASWAALFFLALPAVGQAPRVPMFERLDKGAWELKGRGTGGQRRICVRSGRELVQLRHSQARCDQLVVQNDPDEVAVQYTCQGSGSGRTTIRREDNGLVQLRSQGILNGTPFLWEGEARRRGAC